MAIRLISTNDKDMVNGMRNTTKEFGHLIEMDDFMKRVVYVYLNGEKNIFYMLAKQARLE